MLWGCALGLVAGMALLAWSANLFVGNAAQLARRFGVSTFIVGMFIVGFGTSLPEMMVSFFSALEGNPSIALGNAYGSNVANILLILGISVLLKPMAVSPAAVKRDLPILAAVTVISGVLLVDGELGRGDAAVLIGAFILWTLWDIKTAKEGASAPESEAAEASAVAGGRSVASIVACVVLGLVMLVFSSRLLVVSAVKLATAAKVPDLVIGLTVVAVGTSLPELASSVAAAAKGENDLAIGNIIGSNIFNTLAVVGIACAVKPMTDAGSVEVIARVVARDYPVMVGATALMCFLCALRRKGRDAVIGRFAGAVFLACYLAYIAVLAREALAK